MSADATPTTPTLSTVEVHQQLGALTRQLHDSLNGLGLAEKVKDWAGELPDAKSRLSYIARLTGQAAEKVLNQVDQAKEQHDFIAAETRRIGQLIVKDPVAAVAKRPCDEFHQRCGSPTAHREAETAKAHRG